MKIHLLLALAGLTGSLAVSGCKSYDVSQAPSSVLAISPEMDLGKVRAAVLAGINERGWNIVRESPGLADLTYKGFAARVTYTTSSFTVVQTGGNREVTGWITKLAQEINVRIVRSQP